MIGFDFLFEPVEHLDDSLAGLFEGAPLAVALGIAFLLGLRHATDPDHLMAVTALVARDQSSTRSAARLGAIWGAGHATALLLIGLPLILLGTALPNPLEASAALAVFAPMSVASMALCTSGFAWTLSRPAVIPVYQTVLMPMLGALGLLFGIWYIGLT